jgi:hypothetical protein
MAQHNTEVVKLTGKIVARSKAAVLFAIFPEDLCLDQEEFLECIKAKNPDVLQEWIPLSQTKSIHETFSIVTETFDTIVITQWIAKTKGLV